MLRALLLSRIAAIWLRYFRAISRSARDIPKCDVLFLYATLEPSTRVGGRELSLRDVIKAAGARIAVVASELPAAVLSNREFGQALTAGTDWPANIVITLNRNGDTFGKFFRELFSKMRSGVTMPMAWVALAPQGPQQRSDIPGTICLMEAGHIALGPKKS